MDFLGLRERKNKLEISHRVVLPVAKGIFAGGGVSVKVEVDDPDTCPPPCCKHYTIIAIMEVGGGFKLKYSSDTIIGVFRGGFTAGAEFSVVKHQRELSHEVKCCHTTGEVSGLSEFDILNFDLGMNASAHGPLYLGLRNDCFSVEGEVSGTARMSLNVRAWIVASGRENGGGVYLGVWGSSDFDMSLDLHSSYKIFTKGKVWRKAEWKPKLGSIFGGDTPNTRDQELQGRVFGG